MHRRQVLYTIYEAAGTFRYDFLTYAQRARKYYWGAMKFEVRNPEAAPLIHTPNHNALEAANIKNVTGVRRAAPGGGAQYTQGDGQPYPRGGEQYV